MFSTMNILVVKLVMIIKKILFACLFVLTLILFTVSTTQIYADNMIDSDPYADKLLKNMYNICGDTEQAGHKDSDFTSCSREKLYTCLKTTKPQDPNDCLIPADKQCEYIINDFVKICPHANKCGNNEEIKDNKCVCKKGFERVNEKCAIVMEGELTEIKGSLTIKSIQGPVQIQPSGKAEVQAMENTQLKVGDEIFTGYDGQTVLETKEGDLILLKGLTQVNVVNVEARKFDIKLYKGEIEARVKVTGPSRPDVRIETPTSTTSVRGTKFIVAVANDGTTDVLVAEGTVAVKNNTTGQEILVPAGQKITSTADSLSSKSPLTQTEINRFSSLKNTTGQDYLLGAIIILILGIGTFFAIRKLKKRN